MILGEFSSLLTVVLWSRQGGREFSVFFRGWFSWCFGVVVRVCGFFGCLVFSEEGGGRRRFFLVASPFLAAADPYQRR